MAALVPRAKQLSRFPPQLTQSWPSRRTPPRSSQPPHWLPSHQRCHIAESRPRPKQSIRFAPQLTQFGASRITPPRFSQPPQALPSRSEEHTSELQSRENLV